MAQFIKAYNERDRTVFELKVIAMTKRGAKIRAMSNFFVRNPGEVTATNIRQIKAKPLGDGAFKEFRVTIPVMVDGDIRDIIKLNDAIDFVEEKL